MQLVSVDGGASSFRFESDDQFRKLFKICSLTVRDFFIPKQVSGNYMGYVKWKFLHRLFSSALQVLATQVMLLFLKVSFYPIELMISLLSYIFNFSDWVNDTIAELYI